MTLRLGTFSYLPPFSGEELAGQIRYLLETGLIPAVEHSSDPRKTYWGMWKLPLFEAGSVEEVLAELEACRAAHPEDYVKLIGYDPRRQGQAVSFVVHRPA